MGKLTLLWFIQFNHLIILYIVLSVVTLEPCLASTPHPDIADLVSATSSVSSSTPTTAGGNSSLQSHTDTVTGASIVYSSTDSIDSSVTTTVNTDPLTASTPSSSTLSLLLYTAKTSKVPDASISTDILSDSMGNSSTVPSATEEGKLTKLFQISFQSQCLEAFMNKSNESSHISSQISHASIVNLTLVSIKCSNNTLHVEVYSQVDLQYVFKMGNITFTFYYEGYRYEYEPISVELIFKQDVPMTTILPTELNTETKSPDIIITTVVYEHKETSGHENLNIWNKLSEIERILIIISSVVCFVLIVFGIIFMCRTLNYRNHTKSFNLGKTSIHIEVGPQDYVLEKMERPKMVYNNDGTIMYANTGTLYPPIPPAPSPSLSQHLRYSLRKEKQRIHRSRLEFTQDMDDFNFDSESTLSRLERKLMQKSLEAEMQGIDNPIFMNDEEDLPPGGNKENAPDIETQSNDSGVDGSSLGSGLKKEQPLV